MRSIQRSCVCQYVGGVSPINAAYLPIPIGSKKRWVKRYLELELAQLHVYKEKGGKYVTSIALRGSEVRLESSTVLVVQCAREVWNVRCESAEDAASLCKIMAQRSSGKLDF